MIPFYFEHELRARSSPRGVIARLDPYESYYWSPEHKERPAAIPRHPLRRGHRGARGRPGGNRELTSGSTMTRGPIRP